MGQIVALTAKDGHTLDAYRADPTGTPKGALVVIQEIFGVNRHMRTVCDGFAKEGYVAVAPALFDRVKKGVELGYGQADMQAGREMRGKLTDEQILADVAAAGEAAKGAGKVAVVGYCFGGYVAWISAGTLDLTAAVGYYGGGIAGKKTLKPRCPVQLHFGDKDQAIPLSDVQAVKEAQPEVSVFVYDDAGHGFCCDERPSFNPDACARARKRTLDFLAQHMK